MEPVRAAVRDELDHLAQLWFDGWQDAHYRILPEALRRFRTLDSFHDRLNAALPHVRVIGPAGTPVGFSIVKHDELYQLYIAAPARGTGAAATLLDDAEGRMARSGVEKAWLACAIGNERAARFYEKHGWQRVGVMVSQLETPEGLFPLEVWRYEKTLPHRPLR
jgi:ribosomal protein S18 acetylase RimI-like enzyme